MPILSMTENAARSHMTDSQILAGYLPKLIRLAERNMSSQLRQKVDAEDVGQSVMGSVIRQAKEGILQIEQSDDFWRLIMTITLNKVRKKVRHFKAQKRDISREQAISPDGPQLAELAIDFRCLPEIPSLEDAAALSEVLNQLDTRLDPKCRQVLAARLQNLPQGEIAKQLNVSTKSIGRYMKKIETVVQQLLYEEEG